MGTKSSLPKEIEESAKKLFNRMDIDGSNTVDKEETMIFFGKKFGKLSADQLFKSVDKNNDGTIQESEWLEYWQRVYSAGHSKEEIFEVLNDIKKRGIWIKFLDVDDLNKVKKMSTRSYRKRK